MDPLELSEARVALESLLTKCEKAASRLKSPSPQNTLMTRRIEALKVALLLIQREHKAQEPPLD